MTSRILISVAVLSLAVKLGSGETLAQKRAAESKAWVEKTAKQIQNAEDAKKQRAKEMLDPSVAAEEPAAEIESEGLRDETPVGWQWAGEIVQVVDDRIVLFRIGCTPETYKVIAVELPDTIDLFDGQKITFRGLQLDGTFRYVSVLGAAKTVEKYTGIR